VRLAEVVVEGDRTIIAFGKLADFFRRRRTGQGTFMTDWEIRQRNAFYTTDLLRRVPGMSVTFNSWGRPVLRSRRLRARLRAGGIRGRDAAVGGPGAG
jgi:hypothetical protein